MAVTADEVTGVRPGVRPPGPAGLDAEQLARALSYPYDRPPGSFVYDAAAHRVTPLAPLAPSGLAGWSSGRQAVLAVGSNAAPDQLRRKFGAFAGERRMAALAVDVRDHDVVYAARVSSYGAVPATLVPCPGVTVSVTVLLLTHEQLVRMGETESLGRAYDLVPVDGALLSHEGRPFGEVVAATSVGCYSAVCGALRVRGAPVALAAVTAIGRTWPEATEEDLLRRLAASRGMGLDDFARRLVGDVGYRAGVVAALARGSLDL